MLAGRSHILASLMAAVLLSAVTVQEPAHAHAQAQAQTQEWKRVCVKRGLELMSRTVKGERFPEFRIRTTTTVPCSRLAEYLMGNSIELAERDIKRTMVKRSADLVIFTDLIKTPVINDRCATTRMSLDKSGKDGNIEVVFSSSGEWPKGKPTRSCIPVRAHGSWAFREVEGRTELTYTIFADPGGNVPAFLVSGMIADDAMNRVRELIRDCAK